MPNEHNMMTRGTVSKKKKTTSRRR
eukprot:COSAG06_NODE_20439_length_795_cov_1613.063218_1_plen_24_part_10